MTAVPSVRGFLKADHVEMSHALRLPKSPTFVQFEFPEHGNFLP